MTTVLEGGEWSAARPSCTLSLGKTWYPFYRRLGGPQGRSGRAENLTPHRDSILDHPACSQSLYRLSYPAHRKIFNNNWYVRNYSVIIVKYMLTITGKCNWTLFILWMNNQLHACSLSTWTVYHGTHHQAHICVRISMRKLRCRVKTKVTMNKWKQKYISTLTLHQLPWLTSFWSFHRWYSPEQHQGIRQDSISSNFYILTSHHAIFFSTTQYDDKTFVK